MWLLAQGRSAGSAQILQELEEELTCRRRDCSSQHDPLQTISRTASAAECNLIFARISVRQYQGMRWLNWDPHVSDEIYDRTVQFIDSWMAPRYRSLQITSNGRNTLVGPGPGSCTQFTRSTRPEFEWFLFDQPSWRHVVGSSSRGAAFW